MTKTFEGIVNKLKQFDQVLSKEEGTKYTFSKKLEVRREEYRKILRELLNFDTILTPEETISLGLADEIYSPT
jgi:ATP-dependent protease ClpP protease subunit